MVAGFLHGELTILLWGGAFSFAWAYTVAARWVAGRHPLVRSAHGRLASIGPEGLTFVTDEVPPAPAFFHWSIVVTGVHSPQRVFQETAPLAAGDTCFSLRLPRGQYAVEGWWELADVFGFTRLIAATRWTTAHIVPSGAVPYEPPPPPAVRQGPWRPRRSGNRAGDPFDVRKYNPGDDLRRLHWPLYAHAGVPFVRTAEPSPPPTGHQFLVLDTDAASEEDLDRRVAQLAAWLGHLDAQGTRWTLVVPATDRVLSSNASTVLAGLTPAPFPDVRTDSWPAIVTLLTGPSSWAATALIQRLSGSGRKLRTVASPLSVPSSPTRAWWERIP